jgi:hypothetical protein
LLLYLPHITKKSAAVSIGLLRSVASRAEPARAVPLLSKNRLPVALL